MQEFITPVKALFYCENESISLKDFIYTPHLSNHEKCLSTKNNSIHLCYPRNVAEIRTVKKRLTSNKIIQESKNEGIYILHEKLNPNSSNPLIRHSLIVNFQVTEHQTHLIPHEKTFEIYELEKLEILQSCNLNTLPSLAYYRDEHSDITEELLPHAKSILNEKSTEIDIELFQITNPEIVTKACQHLCKNTYLLADGHHRLAGSKRLAKSVGGAVNHLVQIVNDHYSPPELDSFTFMIDQLQPIDFKKINTHFQVQKVTTLPNIRKDQIIDLISPEGFFELTPILENPAQTFTDFLDYFYHDLLIGKVFELTDQELNKQTRCFHLGKWKDIRELVASGGHIGLRPPRVPIEEIFSKASKGELFAEKSTRFLPKITCGILLGKVDIKA